MPLYDIKCEGCDHSDFWTKTIEKYEKDLKKPCPKCGKKKLYQDFSTRKTLPFELVGFGWQRKSARKGSKEDLGNALRENDYFLNKAKSNDHLDNKTANQYYQEHPEDRFKK